MPKCFKNPIAVYGAASLQKFNKLFIVCSFPFETFIQKGRTAITLEFSFIFIEADIFKLDFIPEIHDLLSKDGDLLG